MLGKQGEGPVARSEAEWRFAPGEGEDPAAPFDLSSPPPESRKTKARSCAGKLFLLRPAAEYLPPKPASIYMAGSTWPRISPSGKFAV